MKKSSIIYSIIIVVLVIIIALITSRLYYWKNSVKEGEAEEKEFLESYKTEGISIYLVYDNDNNEHIIVKENDKIISEYNVWPEDNSKIKQLR